MGLRFVNSVSISCRVIQEACIATPVGQKNPVQARSEEYLIPVCPDTTRPTGVKMNFYGL